MRVNKYIYGLILALVAFIIFHFGHILFEATFLRPYRKVKYYKMAQEVAKKKNKKLLVIGDPYSGHMTTIIGRNILGNYGCGDLCTDLNGCPQCPNAKKGYLEEVIPKMKTNSCVIFIASVLEYVDDLDKLYKELERVSGKDLFIVYCKEKVHGHKLKNNYFEKTLGRDLMMKNIIMEAPPESNRFKFRKVNSYWD